MGNMKKSTYKLESHENNITKTKIPVKLNSYSFVALWISYSRLNNVSKTL